MMGDPGSYKELLYQYEIVRTRLEIRQYYLQTAVLEVYENIGQALSLIRIQLSMLQGDSQKVGDEKIEYSRQLVGKTIQDLRKMCHLFYPENYILNGAEYFRAVEQAVKNEFPAVKFVLDQHMLTSVPEVSDRLLILFGVLLELFTLIKNEQGEVTSMIMKWRRKEVSILVDHTGTVITKYKMDAQSTSFNISVLKRIEIMGASYKIKKTERDIKRIKLVLPNYEHYGKNKSGSGR